MNLVSYRTSGRPPRTSVSQSASLKILGTILFINHAGVGSLFVGCASAASCHAVTMINSGKTELARTGSEFLGGQDLGTVFFKLSPGALAQLNRTRGNQMPVQVTVANGRDVARAQLFMTRF
jgi:hypothetical protein